MENNKMFAGVIALIVITLLVGGGLWLMNRDNSGEEAAEPTSQSQQVEQKKPGSIVAVASDAPNLSTLVTAVKAASLAETLQGSGQFSSLLIVVLPLPSIRAIALSL